MRYVVRVGEEELVVDVAGTAVRVGDDEPLAAHIESAGDGPALLLTLGTEVHRVVARRGAERGRYTLWLDGRRFDVEAVDERTNAIRRLSTPAGIRAGPAQVVAPMPGLVVRVNVSPGDAVHPGQGVVVMEAMKMENELRASTAGTVRAVLVQPGTAVEKGAVLIELA